MPKRPHSFDENHEPQYKIRVTNKLAIENNRVFQQEIHNKTLRMLYAGANRTINTKDVQTPLTDLPESLSFCAHKTSETVLKCWFCEREICTSCVLICDACLEYFCNSCTIQLYDDSKYKVACFHCIK